MGQLTRTPEAGTRRHPRRFSAKQWLWVLLGAAVVFVFLSNELLLIADYPLYHQYRGQLVVDHRLLIPHVLFGTIALLSGPVQFSTRLRQRFLFLHSVLGRVYVGSVLFAALLAMTLSWHRPLQAGTLTQAGAWMLCTAAAWITAQNRQIAQHRQWMARSYAVTFTFIALRLLSLWPRYWNIADGNEVLLIVIVTFASILLVDLGLNWRELTRKRMA